jgi:hypothetical protein
MGPMGTVNKSDTDALYEFILLGKFTLSTRV